MANREFILLQKTVEPLLKELLADSPFQSLPRTFAYPNSVLKESILFIGINPSNSNEKHEEIESYELLQNDNGHPYFRKFQEIAEYCIRPWSHFDLLFFRETDQSRINELLKTDVGLDFLWKQLLVSDKIIRETNAEIIVVNNTLARRFLGLDRIGNNNVWLNYEFVFDNEIGTYRWEGIPVFFSSMLTGQRALDRGSFERLKWHIRNTLIFDLEKKKNEVVAFKNEVVKSTKYELAAEFRDQERELENKLSKLRFSYGHSEQN